MKKRITSILLTVVMLIAFTVPAFADSFGYKSKTEEIPQGTYNGIHIRSDANILINSDVRLSDVTELRLEKNAVLRVGSEGSLTGLESYFSINGTGQKIEIENGGVLDIFFDNDESVETMMSVLDASGIAYEQWERRIIAAGCPHEHTEPRTRCLDCGLVLPADFPTSGSVISEGNMTVVCSIACLVIGLCGGFVFGKKKKPVPSNSTSAEGEQ